MFGRCSQRFRISPPRPVLLVHGHWVSHMLRIFGSVAVLKLPRERGSNAALPSNLFGTVALNKAVQGYHIFQSCFPGKIYRRDYSNLATRGESLPSKSFYTAARRSPAAAKAFALLIPAAVSAAVSLAPPLPASPPFFFGASSSTSSAAIPTGARRVPPPP